MAFLQKKPHTESTTPLYTLSTNQTVLIVGLGNPGSEYEHTRHNIGFTCLEAFAASVQLAPWQVKKDLKCMVATANLGAVRVIAIKPTTFMNLSGEAVQAASHFYKPDSIVVVHDELDIPFGQIRLRSGGSAAGHNGVKSVSQIIGEDYGRVRVGIGPKVPEQIDSADFVLQKFSQQELSDIPSLCTEVTAILNEYVYGGQVLPTETRSFLA